MIKLVVFLAILLALATGLAWLADQDGVITLTWLGTDYSVTLLVGVLGFFALLIAVMILWSAVRTLLRLPGLFSLASRNRRKQKGYDAVTRGLLAVAAGDGRAAGREASDALRLMGQQPAALLLSAQSAQMIGDADKAGKAFSAMLDHADTRLVGLRGLFIESERRSDAAAAKFYADEAYKLSPAASWASDAALSYRCMEGDWQGAIRIVEQAVSRRLIDKAEGKRKRALLLTAEAHARENTESDAAYRAAEEAVRLDPTLVPAVVFVAKRLSEKGSFSRASKVIETAWPALPHPDLAEAYLAVRVGDSGKDKLKRARALLKLTPADPEARLTMARAAIDAREFAVARENLELVVLEHPTVRACVLMAELEEAESGNMGLVREWLARASRAPRDKAWIADGKITYTWSAISPSGKLGGYVWGTPPQPMGTLLIGDLSQRAVPRTPLAMPPAAMLPVAPPASEIIDIVPTTPPTASAETPSAPLPVPDDPGPEAAAGQPRKKSAWRVFG